MVLWPGEGSQVTRSPAAPLRCVFRDKPDQQCVRAARRVGRRRSRFTGLRGGLGIGLSLLAAVPGEAIRVFPSAGRAEIIGAGVVVRLGSRAVTGDVVMMS